MELSPRILAIQRARALVQNVKQNTADSEVANAAQVVRARATVSAAAENVALKTTAVQKAIKRAKQSKQLSDTANSDLKRAKKIVDLVATGKVPINQCMPRQVKERMVMSRLPPMPHETKKRTAQSLLDIDISLESENDGCM